MPNNGVLVFVIEGSVLIRPDILNQRDSLLVSPGEYLEFKAQKEADILFLEVPME